MTGRKIQHRDQLNSLIAEAQLKPRPFDVLIVDEQSRVSRKLKDLLGAAEVLKHFGVKLHILALRLDSDDPSFQAMITFNGLNDENNSEHLRHSVRRGQEGSVRKGFTSRSRCFGYRSVPVVDTTRPELRAARHFSVSSWK